MAHFQYHVQIKTLGIHIPSCFIITLSLLYNDEGVKRVFYKDDNIYSV